MVVALKPRRTRVHHRPLPDAPRFDRVPEGDGYARTRFHGQPRRGGMSPVARDAQDVAHAISVLGDAHALLVRAEAPGVTPIERREMLAEARAKAGLAERFANNVAEARPSWER